MEFIVRFHELPDGVPGERVEADLREAVTQAAMRHLGPETWVEITDYEPFPTGARSREPHMIIRQGAIKIRQMIKVIPQYRGKLPKGLSGLIGRLWRIAEEKGNTPSPAGVVDTRGRVDQFLDGLKEEGKAEAAVKDNPPPPPPPPPEEQCVIPEVEDFVPPPSPRKEQRVRDEYPELLTIKEVATELGCSESHVHRLVRDGHLPVLALGRSRRIRKPDLQRFMWSKGAPSS
jgi:excisionase family DNA binding protein